MWEYQVASIFLTIIGIKLFDSFFSILARYFGPEIKIERPQPSGATITQNENDNATPTAPLMASNAEDLDRIKDKSLGQGSMANMPVTEISGMDGDVAAPSVLNSDSMLPLGLDRWRLEEATPEVQANEAIDTDDGSSESGENGNPVIITPESGNSEQGDTDQGTNETTIDNERGKAKGEDDEEGDSEQNSTEEQVIEQRPLDKGKGNAIDGDEQANDGQQSSRHTTAQRVTLPEGFDEKNIPLSEEQFVEVLRLEGRIPSGAGPSDETIRLGRVLDEAKDVTTVVKVKVSTDTGDIVQVVMPKERYENFKIQQRIIKDHMDGWVQFQERLGQQEDALCEEYNELEKERDLRLTNLQLATPAFQEARKEAYRYVNATNRRARDLERKYRKREVHLQLMDVTYNQTQTRREQLGDNLKAAISKEDHVRLQAAWLNGVIRRYANLSHLKVIKKLYEFDMSNATSEKERLKIRLDFERSCAQLGKGGPGIYPLNLVD